MADERVLKKGRWVPQVHQWLDTLLARSPGVICLDWDETCAAGDIGEALMDYLDPSGGALRAYEAELARGDVLKAYVESLYILAGRSVEEVSRVCSEAVVWAIEAGRVEQRPEMKNLMKVADSLGWEVWVVTASATPLVQAFSALYDHPSDRVIGMDLRQKDGWVLPELESVATYRQGKVDAIIQRIGKPVDLAVGDTLTDLEMLISAKNGLVIGPRHPLLAEEALARGWAIQPLFESA